MRNAVQLVLVTLLLSGVTSCMNDATHSSIPGSGDVYEHTEIHTSHVSVSEDASQPDQENPSDDVLCSSDSDNVNVVHIDFSFLGDTMLADYKGQRTKNGFFDVYDHEGPGWCFDKVRDILSSDDFTIADIENVFTDQTLPERIKDENPGYWYKAPTKYASALLDGSIEVGDLNNNHVGDYGTAGKQDTQNVLSDLGILHGSMNDPCYFEKDGIKIGLVCAGLWNNSQAQAIKDTVVEVKANCDVCIVFFHGGEMLVHTPDDFKVKGAHNAIDSGADLVVGCHPHCLQPSEVYEGSTIVYSLGNFCYGGSKKPENRTVIFQWSIDVDSETKEIISESSSFIPCYVYTGDTNNFQPAPIEDEQEKQNVLDFMLGMRKSPF